MTVVVEASESSVEVVEFEWIDGVLVVSGVAVWVSSWCVRFRSSMVVETVVVSVVWLPLEHLALGYSMIVVWDLTFGIETIKRLLLSEISLTVEASESVEVEVVAYIWIHWWSHRRGPRSHGVSSVLNGRGGFCSLIVDWTFSTLSFGIISSNCWLKRRPLFDFWHYWKYQTIIVVWDLFDCWSLWISGGRGCWIWIHWWSSRGLRSHGVSSSVLMVVAVSGVWLLIERLVRLALG